MSQDLRRSPEACSRRVARGCRVGLAFALIAAQSGAARAETVDLDRIDHIHGVTVDSEHPERLFLATHSGLFLASPEGNAKRVGGSEDDLMSFAADAESPDTFYASGHPPGGGNLGVMVSRDRGRNWEQLVEGASDPVDFHALAVSPADPNVIYGIYAGLQVSADRGRSWKATGTLPDDTLDLAASAHDSATLFAGTRGGLMVSQDGGESWSAADVQQGPTTLVHVGQDGRAYAFIYGLGLMASDETATTWELRSDGFADRYLIHMASDPSRPEVLHAVVDTGSIVTSRDAGRSWVSYVGHDRESLATIVEGARHYDRLCKSCHGEDGMGERPGEPGVVDEYGFVAPALDDSAHAWHHGDDDLARMILEGSARNPRMLPFEAMLTREEAQSLVAYIRASGASAVSPAREHGSCAACTKNVPTKVTWLRHYSPHPLTAGPDVDEPIGFAPFRREAGQVNAGVDLLFAASPSPVPVPGASSVRLQNPMGGTSRALLNLLDRFWKAIRPVSSTIASSSR